MRGDSTECLIGYRAPMSMMEVLADELEPGTIVAGRYVLERVVGEGGMGVVWAAKHTVTGKPFALKFLKESRASDPKSQRRLVREAKAACAVRHPAVAEVLDVLELDSGAPFLVMDLLEGETLTAKLARQGTLTTADVEAIFVPVVEALRAAHEVGVVHRDLKPENVFLARTTDGRTQVKVVDFGIAKLASLSDSPHVTDTGDLVGTPMYMAPEVVFGELDVDGRADVWALGVMLYEAFAGAAPTSAATVGLTLKAITRETIRPLGEVAPDVPAHLAAVIMCMLSQDREARPALTDVQRALEGKSDPTTTGRTAVEELSPTAHASAQPSDLPRVRTRWRRALMPLAALSTLAAVALGIRAMSAGTDEPPRPSTTAATTKESELPKGIVSALPTPLELVPSSPTSLVLVAPPSHIGSAPSRPSAHPLDASATSLGDASRPTGHDSGIILSHDRK